MIVLDTGLIFAVYNEDDQNHANAINIFKSIFQGKYAQPVLLDYVYDELMTLIYIRTKTFDLCKEISELLHEFISKGNITFVHTPSEIFWKANQIFINQEINNQKRFLSFTDAIIGAMSDWLNASFIGTFDSQFHRFKVKVIPEL